MSSSNAFAADVAVLRVADGLAALICDPATPAHVRSACTEAYVALRRVISEAADREEESARRRTTLTIVGGTAAKESDS